jgi:predicted 3-demethylubiquinone-9 3-methyltransferase (glyoxalase superfamily)
MERAKMTEIQMQRITPFLWFDNQAEEAARFYTSIFKNSAIGRISRYGEGAPKPKGSVMVVQFQLAGQEFLALNGGPEFKMGPAISFVVNCETQEEVDEFWEKLSAGGEEIQCGWLKDKFGVSWQVVPTILATLMSDPDAENCRRVTEAMFKMKKLDIRTLTQACAGTGFVEGTEEKEIRERGSGR